MPRLMAHLAPIRWLAVIDSGREGWDQNVTVEAQLLVH
jgi:hypothetical protein